MTGVGSGVGGSGAMVADEDPDRAAIAVTTSLVGLVRLFAAALGAPALITLPRTGGTAVAVAVPVLAALVLARGADRLTATAGRRALLLAADAGAGAVVFAAAGFGIPCAYQSLGTAALAAALYGVPGVVAGAAVGMAATVVTVLQPSFGMAAELPIGIVVSIPTAYALVALVAALVRHLQRDQVVLRQSLRAATWSAARTQERARLARELHDSLAKTLAGIGLCARAVQQDPARGVELAGEIAVAAEEATGQARSMIAGLRETASPDLAAAVRDVVARSGLGGVRIELGPVPEPEPAVRAELVAVLGEALANVRRHADASRVLVALSEVDGALRLTVQDDGHGFTVPASLPDRGRYGLLGMTERLHGVGGTLIVRSRVGSGTAVVAEVPAPAADRVAAGS